jgi:hypothetical protein
MSGFEKFKTVKIGLAFGSCIVLMIAIGLFSIQELIKFHSSISDANANGTISISDLSDAREASLDIQLQLRMAQALHDREKTATAVGVIHNDQERIYKTLSRIYPGEGLEHDVRTSSDTIGSAPASFKAAVDDAVGALSSGNMDAVEAAIEKVESRAEVLQKELSTDAAVNLEKAKQLANDSDAMFRKMLLIEIVLLSVGLVICVAASWYVRRLVSKWPDFVEAASYNKREQVARKSVL